MPANNSQQPALAREPGRVTFMDGQNEMPMLEIHTAWSSAEIYLHGAHVTRFKEHDKPPLLFMSTCSRFQAEQPIRGGIPVIFPWFGMREGLGQHGFARVKDWDIKEILPIADGSVSVRFRLPYCPEASGIHPFTADYLVTVSQNLQLELLIKNCSQETLTFEECLHTYFDVGDATAIAIEGLQGAQYLDKAANFARKTETDPEIRINSEIDRTYLDTTTEVRIIDPRLGRRIRIGKQNSRSTVVWNPWIAKAQQMPDFGNDEYQRMVCVESGNLGESEIALKPGQTSHLIVKISAENLA